jgi:hypothetical protein
MKREMRKKWRHRKSQAGIMLEKCDKSCSAKTMIKMS